MIRVSADHYGTGRGGSHDANSPSAVEQASLRAGRLGCAFRVGAAIPGNKSVQVMSDQDQRLSARLRAHLPRPLRARLGGVREWLKDMAVRAEVAVRRQTPRPDAAPGSGRDVLVVDDLVPDPLFGFGFPRMFEVVQSLARAGHRVSVYPMHATIEEVQRVHDLCGGRVRIHHGAAARGLRRLLWKEGGRLDLIFISRPKPMRAFNDIMRVWPGCRPSLVAYDLEAVTTPREAMRRRLFGEEWTPEEQERALLAELDVAHGVDTATVVTQADGDVVASRLGLPTLVVSHPVPVGRAGTDFDERRDFLFVGRMTGRSTEYPNVDAVGWFVREVMPRLDAAIGTDYRVHLVGLFDEEAGALASPRVQLHGAVDDLAPFYNDCRVFVAATRYAAGLPIKVVETLGRGLPCVATPLLAGQIGAEGHGFASDPSAATFADRCALLYTDRDAWRQARDYGLALARNRFSRESFDAALAQLVHGGPAMTHRPSSGQ